MIMMVYSQKPLPQTSVGSVRPTWFESYSNTDSNFQCNFVPFETPANLQREWKVESKFSKKFGSLKGIGFKSPTVSLVTPGLVLRAIKELFFSFDRKGGDTKSSIEE